MRHFDCVVASRLVYSSEEEMGCLLQEHLPSWGLLELVEDEGYRMMAICNHEIKSVIIAHRGTVPEDARNILEDIRIILGTKLAAADTAYASSAKLRSFYADYAVMETGHSLGAIYAEINACRFNTPAVTFDSPGSRVLVREYCSEDVLLDASEKITHYLAAPNPVNTLNAQIGKSIRLYVPYSERSIAAVSEVLRNVYAGGQSLQTSCYELSGVLLKYYLAQHSIKNIMSCFDADAGYPYLQREIRSWPTKEVLLKSKAFYFTFAAAAIINDRDMEESIRILPGLRLGNVITPFMTASDAVEHRYIAELFNQYDQFHRSDLNRKKLLGHLVPFVTAGPSYNLEAIAAESGLLAASLLTSFGVLRVEPQGSVPLTAPLGEEEGADAKSNDGDNSQILSLK